MESLVGLLFFLAGVGGYLAYNGTFYPTGTQYYESCWEKQVQASTNWKQGNTSEPVPSDPYKAAMFSQCDRISEAAIYNAGFLFSGLAKDDHDIDGLALQKACPSLLRDVPIGGVYLLTLKLVADQGGPNFLDKFLPAEEMIERAYKKRWPYCDSERRRQNYPKIVMKSNGEFGWAARCLPCEERQQNPKTN